MTSYVQIKGTCLPDVLKRSCRNSALEHPYLHAEGSVVLYDKVIPKIGLSVFLLIPTHLCSYNTSDNCQIPLTHL